ncbi:MAG: acyl--CoA ligase [Candidatus Melainabacteria bacterium]|jgi:acyl-CoA synthetase (AMP-forming)/AMP-acid ligase II|nr:acyl--CoA ligase [Candidatus Melainabacteria bacterium]
MTNPKDVLNKLLYPVSEDPERSSLPAVIETDVETPGASGSKHRQYSYKEFQSLIDAAEETFIGAGVEKGNRVMMSAPNSARLLASILALWRIGAVAVLVDARVTPQEVQNVAKRLKVKLLCGSLRHAPDFFSANETMKEAQVGLLDLCAIADAPKNASSLSRREKSDEELKEPAFIILTSGTTGTPKGAVHDLYSLMINLEELGQMASIKLEMRGLLPLPLSHIFGLEVNLICALYGASVTYCDLTPNGFFACINKYDPHILVGVPTVYAAMLNIQDGLMNMNSAHILLSGGAPLPVSLAEDFLKKYGKKLNNGYGSTESKIIALNLIGPHDSVGKPIPSVTVEIVDENDKVLSEGETGEITISGSNLMLAYVDNPEATAKAVRNGRYYTGDLGHIQDRQIFISGRAKEMIVVAGNKVFPAEVEDVLLNHPNAAEVAVVGVPHKSLGQTVKAIIVIKDKKLSEQLQEGGDAKKAARQELIAQFKDYSRDNLKRELRPMEWDFRAVGDFLPKTLSGKVDKKKLEEKPA